jgi:nitrate/TMAO reductase-like tetraheme cytochrome c subunit
MASPSTEKTQSVHIQDLDKRRLRWPGSDGRGRAKGWRQRLLRWPKLTVDLNIPKHRHRVFAGLFAVVLLTTVFLVAGYQFFLFSESAEFCGELCHPMESVFMRYERSPHANVECAKCHIGPGVTPFIKAKIAGTRELYVLLTDTYERPIKGPVHSLRPAREICEQCHTPISYQDNIIKTITHYDDDEANTPVQTTLILKMGGWQEETGISEGIHWHITNKVYYIAADEQRQVMLWVGTQQNGLMKEYYARDMLNIAWTPFVEEARQNGEMRLMDCMDCHNRVAHLIPPPEEAVDDAINLGLIPARLPNIRTKAVELLTAGYANEAEAHEALDGLAQFYLSDNPGKLTVPEADLDAAIDELKKIYSSTNFPDVKLDWQKSPNNERHNPTLGCFRCHDGKHVSVDQAGNEAEVISVKCNLCHTVPIVGRGDEMLIEAPVIAGDLPESHADFRFTLEHRSVSEEEREECYECHGRGFCNNRACHGISHPPDMLYSHAEEYRKTGDKACYTCHQDILCSRCHPQGAISNPSPGQE